MPVSATYASNVTVVETLDAAQAPAAPVGSRVITHNGYNVTETLNANSIPPATKQVSKEIPLSTGAATIDLTTITGTNSIVVDGTGLRPQFIKLRNKSTNANNMTFTQGASNGLDTLGSDFKIILPPGGEILIRTVDAGSDISSTNKTIDIAGTGSQIAEVIFVMG